MIAIDWSKMITKEMKEAAAREQHLAQVQAEIQRLRSIADKAIAPLQDAVDLDMASETEISDLKSWKRFRVELSRVPDQPGYPDQIAWPVMPE